MATATRYLYRHPQVGKALPRAQNDTSVAFRSKAITLPGQSVNADRSGAAVSSHNLTLKVRTEMKHYVDCAWRHHTATPILALRNGRCTALCANTLCGA